MDLGRLHVDSIQAQAEPRIDSLQTSSEALLMKLNKLLLPALVLALLFAANAMAPSAPPEGKAAPPWELARNKVDAARRTCLAVAQEYLEGKATVEQVHQWSQRWMR